MNDSAFPKNPYRPIYRAENAEKYYQNRKYFVRKIFSTGTCRRGPPRSKKNYERYRFSGKILTGRYTVLKMQKNITRVANTLLGKNFRLIRVETTHLVSQKNYERNRFSGKAPPGRYIGLRTPKIIPRVANTSLGKIFRLVLVEKVPKV